MTHFPLSALLFLIAIAVSGCVADLEYSDTTICQRSCLPQDTCKVENGSAICISPNPPRLNEAPAQEVTR